MQTASVLRFELNFSAIENLMHNCNEGISFNKQGFVVVAFILH